MTYQWFSLARSWAAVRRVVGSGTRDGQVTTTKGVIIAQYTRR